MITVTLRIPEDVVEELKQLAPILGFSGYQPLIRAYIGQGMRADLEKLENNTVNALIASLKRHGVSDDVIHEALTEIVNG
jgi:putative aminopeptidase FrvX